MKHCVMYISQPKNLMIEQCDSEEQAKLTVDLLNTGFITAGLPIKFMYEERVSV